MRVHEMIRDNYPAYYSIGRYPVAQTVCVRKVRDEWGILGNFAPTPLLVNGLHFDCAERLFHFLKFREDAVEGRDLLMNVSGGQRIKMLMKHIGKQHHEWLRDDWPMVIVDAMKFCLQTKYEQNEEFRRVLALTDGSFIVEDQTAFPAKTANSWGAKLAGDEYVGPNLLGRLLMELRDQSPTYHTANNALLVGT